MRLAVLSDIHGNRPALEAVLAALASERLDAVVNLGDSLSGPLWPRETAERLMALGWPTIAGNHERQLLALHDIDGAIDGPTDGEPVADADRRRPLGRVPPHDSDRLAAEAITPAQRAWLAAQAPSLRLAGGTVALVHGTPAVDHEPLLETVTPDRGRHGSAGIRAATADEARARLAAWPARDDASARPELLLCGHSHVPRVLALDGLLIVNPGSVGLPAYDHDQPHEHVVETGSPHARWAIVARSAAGWQVDFRLTAYDWPAAAARAEANGRGDWADALATGRVGRRL